VVFLGFDDTIAQVLRWESSAQADDSTAPQDDRVAMRVHERDARAYIEHEAEKTQEQDFCAFHLSCDKNRQKAMEFAATARAKVVNARG